MIYIRDALSAFAWLSPFYSSLLGVAMFGVLGLLCSPSHKELGFLIIVPDFYFRLVTSVLGLASRPEGLSPVKAMKTEVCAGKLGSGQTTRHMMGISDETSVQRLPALYLPESYMPRSAFSQSMNSVQTSPFRSKTKPINGSYQAT
ncbi:hypothetical protein V8E52_002435 [Russula decolorans]